MDALFANANPGFSSRFNKKRIVFEPWTAQQAGDAVISEIVRCNKTVTPEAEAAVHHWCRPSSRCRRGAVRAMSLMPFSLLCIPSAQVG